MRVWWMFVGVGAMVAGSSCLSPTEVRLVLSTDVGCDVAIAKGATVRVGSGTADPQAISATTHDCNADAMGDVVLIPGASGDAVAVTVVLGVSKPSDACDPQKPDGCVVARRRISYVSHTPLTLPIKLSKSCLAVNCPVDQTCVDGACRSSTVDTGKCNAGVCDDGTLTPPIDADASVPPDAGCGDLTTDPRNCGKCGFVCAGTCVAGRCNLTTSLTSDPHSCLAVDTANVYVTNGAGVGSLRSVPKAGGVAKTLTATKNSFAIAASPTEVYYNSDVSIFALTSTKPLTTTTMPAASLAIDDPPTTLAIAADTRGYAYVLSSMSVSSFSIPGSTSLFAASTNQVAYATLSDGTLGHANAKTTGYVYTASLTGVRGLAVTKKGIIYFDDEAGKVWRGTTQGAAPVNIATQQDHPQAMTFDELNDTLYWVNQGTTPNVGSVMALKGVSTSSPTLVTLAASQNQPYCIAQDADAVYWLNGGVPTRMAK